MKTKSEVFALLADMFEAKRNTSVHICNTIDHDLDLTQIPKSECLAIIRGWASWTTGLMFGGIGDRTGLDAVYCPWYDAWTDESREVRIKLLRYLSEVYK